VIALLVGLAAGVVWAWNKFEGFRSFMLGMNEVFIEFHRLIYDFAIAPLMAMGKTLMGVFTFDKSLMAEGMSDSMKAFEKISEGAGGRIKDAWGRGWDKGANAPKVGLPDFLTGGGTADAVSKAFGGNVPGGAGGAGGSGKDKSMTQGIEGITGGGSKNITISVGSMVENMTIQAQNMKEGTVEMREMIIRELMQALNSANLAQ
jgi:hypothetical protein